MELIIDTDVLIEFFRGREQASRFFENLENPPSVSVIKVVELYSGVREGKERTELEGFLKGITILDVTAEIAIRGGLLFRDFGRSHGVRQNDAIIAATAEIQSRTLATFNKKHFPMLSNVLVPYQRT